jgi:pimeloyl-[acyl-carrier protein] methyl ester esterase
MQNLVLIHGFGFGSYIFTELEQKLKNQYNITTLNLPGHGDNEFVSDNLDDWVNNIKDKIPENAIILGWSLGGLLAIKLTQIVQVKKIILVASSPKFVNDSIWQYGIPTNNFKMFSDNLNANIAKGLTRFVSLQGLEKTQIKQLKPQIEQNLPSILGLNNALKILQNTDLRKELLQIKDKTQVILGNKDTIVPFEIYNWYQDNGFNIKVYNTGHIPFLAKDFNLTNFD